MKSLISAHQRGIKVRVLFERKGRSTQLYDDDLARANEVTAEELARVGVEVRFDLPHKTTHAKVVIIERRDVFQGNHNFTKSAFMYNNELSLLIDSPSLASKALDYMEHIKSEKKTRTRHQP